MTPVGMLVDALNDGRELYVVAPIVAEEMIEIQWIIGIIVVHHSHGVPFHLPFVEQSDAFQNLLE